MVVLFAWNYPEHVKLGFTHCSQQMKNCTCLWASRCDWYWFRLWHKSSFQSSGFSGFHGQKEVKDHLLRHLRGGVEEVIQLLLHMESTSQNHWKPHLSPSHLDCMAIYLMVWLHVSSTPLTHLIKTKTVVFWHFAWFKNLYFSKLSCRTQEVWWTEQNEKWSNLKMV